MNLRWASALTLLMAGSLVYGQELVGANETIKRYLAAKGKPALGELNTLELADVLSRLEPKTAGERWAGTFLRNSQRALTHDIDSEAREAEIGALPPPATWPAIDSWFRENNSPIQYQIFSSYLLGDRKRQRDLIFAFAANKPASRQIWEVMLEFGTEWSDKEMVRTGVLSLIKQTNEAVERDKKKPNTYRYDRMLTLPALVGPFEPDFAKEVIKNALETTTGIVLVKGQKDFEIAVAFGRKDGANYPIARYELIQNTNSSDLYPQLEKWFPKATSINKDRALSFYTQAKILQGSKDIVWSNLDIFEMFNSSRRREAIVEGVSDDYDFRLHQPNVARRVMPLLERTLLTDPNSRELRLYSELSTTLDQRSKMLPLLKQLVARKPKKDDRSQQSEAASLIRKILSDGQTDEQAADLALLHLKRGYGNASQCLAMGQLLHRADLVSSARAKKKDEEQSAEYGTLFELKKYRQLEELVTKDGSDDAAKALMHAYSLLGRNQDVIDLLDTFPNWGEDDLSRLRNSTSYGPDMSVCYDVSKALLALGNRDLALRILRHSLPSDDGIVETYDLYVKTLGDREALVELGKLFEVNPLDPTPLIWKAKILLRQKHLHEAETEIRRAIDFDRFDGDGTVIRKVEAQRVLRDIFAAQGKKAESQNQKSMVESVKFAQLGDKYCEAGLAKTGIAYYKRALGLYPNSFYAHARLAIEYESAGHLAESRLHFKRTFQLLSSSFGRVNEPSYRVDYDLFRSSLGSEIGGQVLSAMLKQSPNDPRLNFHMGNLKLHETHSEESASYFRRAVELDPSYLNALESLSATLVGSPSRKAEQERIELTLLRLDPTGRHGESYRRSPQILNLATYYNAIQRANSIKYADESLYPLEGTINGTNTTGQMRSTSSDSPSERPPGKRLSQFDLFRAANDLINEKESEIND